MSSLAENIEKIRSTAVIGTEIRSAIAEALTQVDGVVTPTIQAVQAQLIAAINNAPEDVRRDISNLQATIEDRTLYVNLSSLGSGDYSMDIVNAS